MHPILVRIPLPGWKFLGDDLGHALETVYFYAFACVDKQGPLTNIRS